MGCNEREIWRRFRYFAEIAQCVGLKDTHTEENSLQRYYSKVTSISQESVLWNFLSMEESAIKQKRDEYFYPFGFNLSQKKAIERAFENQISLIEGPPGTGKTQTILNIIANALMQNQKVAVVSNNNSATQNIIDKLKKYELDFFCAFLGSSENKKNFIQNQTKKIPRDFICKSKIMKISQEMKILVDQIEVKLKEQNQLSKLKQEFSSLELEWRYFSKQFPKEINQEKLYDSITVLRVLLRCENCNKEIAVWKKKLYLFLSFFNFKDRSQFVFYSLLRKYSLQDLIPFLQRCFYQARLNELKQEIKKLETSLEDFCFQDKMAEYCQTAMSVFRARLSEIFVRKTRKIYQNFYEVFKDARNFLETYPLILSTTYSLKNCFPQEIEYDFLIIDEASQVDLCTGVLALSCAKRVVVVGDLKQLPNVVEANIAKQTDEIFFKYDLPQAYRYSHQNLLSSFLEIFSNAPKTLLKEHYRCHPKIIDFCNKKFYNNELIILTQEAKERDTLVLYKTLKGNHARNHINQRQIDVILKEIIPQQKLNMHDFSVGIIAPYRNQVKELQKVFKGVNVKIDTVDKFQGQENDVIIFSSVDNQIGSFVDNANRLNVAISRAVQKLVILVNDDEESLKDKNLGDLVKYIEYNNFLVIQSKVSSVFDYLYRQYAQERQNFLISRKKISEFESENLMYALIVEILRDFSSLDVVCHIPLRMILGNFELLNLEERQYALNPKTHIDFLIFDTMNKMPKLAIEVDGVAFHRSGSRQAQRDLLKDQILEKYNLKLLRFRTNGSQEKEKIQLALKEN